MIDLSNMFAISTRELRHVIRSLRAESHQPICGDNRGYYFARTRKEWEEGGSSKLRSRAKSLNECADGGDKYFTDKETSQESLFVDPLKEISPYD